MTSPSPTSSLQSLNRVKLAFGFIVSVLIGIVLFVGLPDMTPYKPQICAVGVMAFCALSCICWAEKNKTIATFAALFPIVPMDLIYLGAIDLNNPVGLLVRCIPFVGNGYDLYRIHISKDLVPEAGWSSNLF
jgi:hypothetical protein